MMFQKSESYFPYPGKKTKYFGKKCKFFEKNPLCLGILIREEGTLV